VTSVFTYSVTQDFPGGKCNTTNLNSEIMASSIVTAIASVSANPVTAPVNDVVQDGTMTVTFKTDLSTTDQNTLDGGAGQPYGTHPAGGLIALHNNSPTPLDTQPVVVNQQAKSNGHYRVIPLSILGIEPSATMYADYVVPDYPRGLDWHNAHLYCGDADSGDQIAVAKLLLGQVGSLAAPNNPGDTVVTVTGPASVLAPTASGGKLDEGFYLSFGVESSSATEINAVSGGPPGTGTPSNPEGELTEYEIYSIGAQTPIGGGNVTVPVTLLVGLAAALTAGTNANLVIRALPDPLPITKGDTINIGGDVLTTGNLPTGSTVRHGYQNNGAAVKNVRGFMTALY